MKKTLKELENEPTDREKVLAWLKFINEDDPKIISEVIEVCSKDIEARKYFVKRYIGDCK